MLTEVELKMVISMICKYLNDINTLMKIRIMHIELLFILFYYHVFISQFFKFPFTLFNYIYCHLFWQIKLFQIKYFIFEINLNFFWNYQLA